MIPKALKLIPYAYITVCTDFLRHEMCLNKNDCILRCLVISIKPSTINTDQVRNSQNIYKKKSSVNLIRFQTLSTKVLS